MIETRQVAGRRAVRYRDLAEFRDEAEQLAATEVRTLGNWSYAQILEHLAKTANSAFDGFGFQAPWFARKLISPLVKNWILTKGMSPGFKLPKNGKSLIPEPLEMGAALANLRAALGRFDRETPSQPHPFFGALASQEWIALTLRHAEMHMSFVVPVAG